jgi:predicted regulator of Ras-like GTPase activity (Roadblock/LC7/MglB family)
MGPITAEDYYLQSELTRLMLNLNGVTGCLRIVTKEGKIIHSHLPDENSRVETIS